MTLTLPTIHLNGTSAEALTTSLRNAITALDSALNALAQTAPHGRDYYPQGDGAYPKALREHLDRAHRVHDVRAELTHIALEIIG